MPGRSRGASTLGSLREGDVWWWVKGGGPCKLHPELGTTERPRRSRWRLLGLTQLTAETGLWTTRLQ